jgi:hypothetical protein
MTSGSNMMTWENGVAAIDEFFGLIAANANGAGSEGGESIG